MNRQIIISADCVCDLPENLLNEYSIQLIPFYISLKEVRFQDYTEINFQSILEYLEMDKQKISSSPASVEEYRAHFLEHSKNNNNIVIHICVSQKLSNAYQHAVLASEELENVYVIDSSLISQGMGLLVLEAAKLAKDGCNPEDILEQLNVIKNKISCSFILKTTHYASSSKRLNQMLFNLLDIFRIKPIIKIKRNEPKICGICQGNGESYVKQYIRQTLRNRKNISDEILFITILSGSEEFRDFVYREATRKINWKQVYIHDASATNLCNIGLGSVGIMFYTN